jgi:DNA repair protein SbcC/Rad50
MHITRVELENVKSHKHSEFEFQRGTTAIMGANGAGKTTIIEAVAWTLFDLLDYKKDDFARRGSKNKGVARVTFQSDLDEREYLVYRDTGTGYYVYDPQLKIKVAEKKEEVSRFLRQHLGVEAGTDLDALFRRAIGVPQGTFTAIFLETAAERKKAFDKLLKVEEYRQGAEKLRETVSFLRNKISEISVKIARSEGELLRFETVENEFNAVTTQISELSETLEKLSGEISERAEAVKKLDEIEAKVNELKTVKDRLQSESNTAEVVQKQKEKDRNAAREAAEKIKSVEADYKAHVAALAELKTLESERIERDKLRSEMSKIETEIVNQKAEQKSCGDNLQKVFEARENISKIQPKVREQEELEKQLEVLRTELAEAKAADKQVTSYEEKLKRLRSNLLEINDKIKAAEEKSAGVENLEDLQRRDTEITGEIARLQAAVEQNEKLERELYETLAKNHFCPILSQKCLNLETGKASKEFVGAKNGDGKKQIAVLQTEQKTVSAKLAQARDAEKSAAVLPNLREQKIKVTEEGTHIRQEQENWKKRAENLTKAEAELSGIESQIKSLDNPKAKLVAYEAEAKRESELKEKISAVEKILERLEAEKANFNEQLSKFETLDATMKRLSDERERTSAAHREYLSNETLAESLREREIELENAVKETAHLKSELEKAATEFEKASKSYDRELHLSEKASLLETEKRLAETRATLEAAKKRETELSGELQRLKIIRLSMQDEFRERERLEKILETTDFIRETLKEAAPRVARNYVHHVSLEAAQMYREITGNAERTLKWTEDYGIMLEENGFERPFINLSGGEQMAAALSVRLALLKQLSDVRLAFFDEPTTNMDAARRERLAEQISHITERKTFDQLFVISHDDTFEGYVDNVVSVGGNADE